MQNMYVFCTEADSPLSLLPPPNLIRRQTCKSVTHSPVAVSNAQSRGDQMSDGQKVSQISLLEHCGNGVAAGSIF